MLKYVVHGLDKPGPDHLRVCRRRCPAIPVSLRCVPRTAVCCCPWKRVRIGMCVERRCRPSKLGSPPLRHVASLLPLLWMVGAVLLDLLENPRRVTSRRVPPVPGDAHHKAGEPSRAHQVVWLLAAVATAAALALRSVGPGPMADGHWKLQLMMMMLLWDDGHCDDRRRHAYPSSERAALQQRSSHISLEVLLRCGPAAVAALPSRARSSVSSEAAAAAMVSAVAEMPSRVRN